MIDAASQFHQQIVANVSGAYNVGDLFGSIFSFEVPIYQRVFTWGDEQFERLFRDLQEHFCVFGKNEPYYLGIITVVRAEADDKLLLVDGQQRLTCILLLGALLGWGLDSSKLTYAARPEDKKALEDVYRICTNGSPKKVEEISTVGNAAMAGFLRFALTPGKGEKLLADLRKQQDAIKNGLTLMISCLPDVPYRTDIFEQNRYFEKMNYGGKQLEPHEILKVRMCKGLDSRYLKIWNAASNFGKCYAVAESQDNEKAMLFSPSLCDVLSPSCPTKDKESFLFKIYQQCERKEQLNQYEFGSEERDALCRGLISFPTFLLHVRCLRLGQTTAQIGDESHLLDLFSGWETRPQEEREQFIELMEVYRKFLDSKIIHIYVAERELRYAFYADIMRDEALREDKADSLEVQRMIQFQSMLYVASDKNQKWLLEAYEEFKDNPHAFTVNRLKQILRRHKEQDSQSMLDIQIAHSILDSSEWPDKCLRYGTPEIRRWLALLDYLLWEKFVRDESELKQLLECEKFHAYKDKIVSAIQNYVFRQNRSVEHLHAQTDSNATNPGEWETAKDMFGNLALISAGKNSEYGNQPVDGKAARVVKLLNDGGLSGSKIESIKLLFMLAKCNGTDDKWTVSTAMEHANDMLKVLKEFLNPDLEGV